MKKGLSLAVAICLGGGALFGGTILTPVDPKAMFLLADTVTPDAPVNPSFLDRDARWHLLEQYDIAGRY